VPGVQTAALIRGLPLTGNSTSARIRLPDREPPPKGQEPQVQFNTATPDYFAAMGIPFVQARLFNDADRLDTPFVIINQTMARRFWPGQDPIGKQVKFIGDDDEPGTVAVVVGDARHDWLSEEQRPQIYNSYSQTPGLFATVVVPTKVEPLSLSQSVREAVWKVDKDQPVWKVRTLESLMAYNIADKRFLMTGVAVGLIASFALTRFIQSLLFEVSPTDALTFTCVSALLGGVALLACYIPARRATKVDPLIALRHE
jgi:putative ABC transport system permease protein